jgi:hypothetical protein
MYLAGLGEIDMKLLFVRIFQLATAAMLSGLVLAGCNKENKLAEAGGAVDVCVNGLDCIDQGWSNSDRYAWYRTSQGSRLLPLDWMLALELPASTADSPNLFMADANMTRLGYLTEAKSDANKEGLPVGFVVDTETGPSADRMCESFPKTCQSRTMRKPWIGMNCSACHTNDITYKGKRIRIEGAPTLADFQALEEDLLQSLIQTKNDPAKFERFAKAINKTENTPENQESLKEQLQEQIDWQQKLAVKNAAPDVRYGHGRLDAQGHILNKVALATLVNDAPANVKADAPASYPFVWNTSQQALIQWNGVAQNDEKPFSFKGKDENFGALGRNAAEVIGVFAHVEFNHGRAITGYKSSVRTDGLVQLEQTLQKLQSPQWKLAFKGVEGKELEIDDEKAKIGRELFVKGKKDAAGQEVLTACAGCHVHLDATDTKSKMNGGDAKFDPMTTIQASGTDLFLACNTFLHESKSGNFAGQNDKPFAKGAVVIKPDKDKTFRMLFNGSIGAIIGDADSLIGKVLSDIFRGGFGARELGPSGIEYLPGVSRDNPKVLDAAACLNAGDVPILAYKARSLNGIWATAPYLHNGSVPTLYDLLLPSRLRNVAQQGEPELDIAEDKRRTEHFGVGLREFDPVKVGFATDKATSPFVFDVYDPDSKQPIPGNYNSGHDYGVGNLTDNERWALVEYMKGL